LWGRLSGSLDSKTGIEGGGVTALLTVCSVWVCLFPGAATATLRRWIDTLLKRISDSATRDLMAEVAPSALNPRIPPSPILTRET
jgi:hypothetical protein